jgi:hypothetical protein
MHTTRLDARTPSGRRIAVWRSAPNPAPAEDGPIVVMCPGFTKSIDQLTCAALFLTANGATVYRFDPLDHVGLSDGTIEHYTLTATMRSFESVLNLVGAREGHRPIVVIATSLSARPALRAVASSPDVDRLITVVGVVCPRDTIAAAFGEELVGLARHALPPLVSLGNHQICPAAMFDDDAAHGWHALEGTLSDIDALRIPIVAVYADRDSYVAADQVERAFGRSSRHRLVKIDAGGHDLDGDISASLHVLSALTAAACTPDPLVANLEPTVVPSLAAIEEAFAGERSWAEAQGAFPGLGS